MNRTITIIAMAAVATLSACDQSAQTITAAGPYDPQANATASAGEINLPPAIAASKSYRCKDNSLVYVDWYSDGTARTKVARNESGTPATAEELKGDAKSATVTVNGKTCHT